MMRYNNKLANLYNHTSIAVYDAAWDMYHQVLDNNGLWQEDDLVKFTMPIDSIVHKAISSLISED